MLRLDRTRLRGFIRRLYAGERGLCPSTGGAVYDLEIPPLPTRERLASGFWGQAQRNSHRESPDRSTAAARAPERRDCVRLAIAANRFAREKEIFDAPRGRA